MFVLWRTGECLFFLLLLLLFNVRTTSEVFKSEHMNSLCHCHRSYNVTCTEELPRPGFPKTCCTIQDIPLIRSPVLPLLLHLLLLLCTSVFVPAEYKSHFVSATAPEAWISTLLCFGSVTSLTHALHKLHLFNLIWNRWQVQKSSCKKNKHHETQAGFFCWGHSSYKCQFYI